MNAYLNITQVAKYVKEYTKKQHSINPFAPNVAKKPNKGYTKVTPVSGYQLERDGMEGISSLRI